MKKISLILVLVTSITFAFGQKSVRQTASNYLKDGKLDKSLEAINQCILDPSTAQDSKAWFIRGNVYLDIANSKDEKFRALDANALVKAMESYKKALEFDPKKETLKKEFYPEIMLRIDKQYRNYFDSAIVNYNKKGYKEAMINFGKSADVLEVVNITDTLSLMNGAMCAGLANDREAAKGFYIRLLKGNYKSPNVYSGLSDIYLKEKDSTNAFKYIRMGLKEYPNNMTLFNSEINIYLTYNIVDKAMSNLNIAMKKDTANYSIPFALGTLYDNIANDTSKSVSQREEAFKNAENSYGKALKVKPDYFDAAFNLGALNLNKASDILVKANNLPPDATAQFDKMKKDADSYLAKSMPHLEKALELQPTDLNTLNALRQIYTRLNLADKKKALQEKINS
ncbi:MAG: hypothetical protein WCK34_13080, partial [Bacteroidota bacterium]